MFWIDIILLVIFLFVVFLSYLRGFLKTILIFVKILLSGFIAYFSQGFLGPIIGKAIPVTYSENMELLLTFVPSNIVESFKNQTATIIGSIIAFIIIFIILYIIFTIVGNMLDRKISNHRITRIANKLGGIVAGIFLGIFAMFVGSFIIAIVLMIYNPTIAISTIYSSFFLKFFVADSISAILQSMASQVGQ